VGGLDESLHYAMDWDLLLKLAKVGKVVAIPDHLANIRYYPETKTNTGGWKRMREIARDCAKSQWSARSEFPLLPNPRPSGEAVDALAAQAL
jgi:hypothetical protein